MSPSNAMVQGTDFSGSAISGTGGVLQLGSGTVTLSGGHSQIGDHDHLPEPSQREAFVTHNDAEHARRREQHASKKATPLVTLGTFDTTTDTLILERQP